MVLLERERLFEMDKSVRGRILTPGAACLAAALEVECSEGRDPRAYVSLVARVLAGMKEAGVLSNVLGSKAHSPRAHRAAIALSTALSSDGVVAADGDVSTSPPRPQLVLRRLQRCLGAVDCLEDFCGQTKRGKFGAVVALGCAARAGKAWTILRHLAGKPGGGVASLSENPLAVLPTQLPALLDTLVDGELVDVRGMTNVKVRLALQHVFECMDLREGRTFLGGGADEGAPGARARHRAEGFGLPERKDEASLVRHSMEVLAAMLRAHDTLAYDDEGTEVAPIDEWAAAAHQGVVDARAVRGPARPSAAEIAAAADAAAGGGAVTAEETKKRETRGPMGPPPGYIMPGAPGAPGGAGVVRNDLDSDSDDDVFGPSPHGPFGGHGDDEFDTDESRATQAASKKRRRDSEWSAVRSGKSAAEAAAAAAAAEARASTGGREQWMLEAPSHEGGLLADLKRQGGAQKARGFQQMLPHSSAWAGMDEPGEEERRRQDQPDAQTEDAIKKSRESRGAPLVEKHLARAAAESKKPLRGGRVTDARGGGEFSWDHSEMMGPSRKMNVHDLNGMIEQAKGLDSKFSRSVFTRQDSA